MRLVGFLRGVPIVAFHALVPVAIVGVAINAMSGALFLMAYPDQYAYNSAFHLKMLCVALAGLNVLVFYRTSFPRIVGLGPDGQADLRARLAGGVSLALWITVIICGRMITFFRPSLCGVGEAAGMVADCIVR